MMIMMKKMMTMMTTMTTMKRMTTEKNSATLNAAITNSADKHKWPDDHQQTEEATN